METLPEQEFPSPTIYVEVGRNTNFGFWELNLIQRVGYLRERSHIIPLGSLIEDRAKEFDTIQQFLENLLTRKHYYNELIPDRKIVWSIDPYCQWESKTADKDDPDTVLYCQHPALVEKNGKLLCGDHARFKL